MDDSRRRDRVSRRKFVSNLAAGSAAVPGLQGAGPGGGAAAKRSVTGLPAYPRQAAGRQLQRIAFPLGGIGAGSVSLGGRGQLLNWEIFNRPDKGNSPGNTLASIYVKAGHGSPIARVLEARFMPPYEGASGLGSATAPGLPRLAGATFVGEFPLATIHFEDPELPVRVSLEAFSPFIPLEADDSGLPVAVLRYRVRNPGAVKAAVSIAFSLSNPVGDRNGAAAFRESGSLSGLFMTNPFLPATDPLAGSFVLGVLDAAGGQLTHWRGWPRLPWGWTGTMLFWDEFSGHGELGPEPEKLSTTGSLCLKREIPAGGEAAYTFLLSWHFPNRTPERCGWSAPKGQEKAVIGNHYCSRFKSAWEAAEHLASGLPELERRTKTFVAAMRETTLPGPVLDAACSNLSTLVTPTCFRTPDGVFHGFEGCSDHAGCCFGTCTHVWNYETATAFLFPSLSRSRREVSFGVNLREDGVMDFRQYLPSGVDHWGHAAADGQMGQIMKLYLDWSLSGDPEWLRKLWPGAKRALAFAWTPGGWDADRDGVMEGVQHNTYDVEFYGPNPLCGVWYLGALRAAEEMAKAVGEPGFAAECRRLFDSGSRWIDANLFNGEYYIQQVRGRPKDQIAKTVASGFYIDPEKPDFQVGDGCLVDQLAGQYLAGVAGLGLLLEERKIRSALRSILKYNYKRTLYHHECVQRAFALNDESGLVICDYGHGRRPRIPFPYFAELMTGFEYSAAILMLQQGMVGPGVEAIANIRRRFDGERRNPWDEAECGHHYARAMASWSAIIALTGFQYSGVSRRMALRPLVHSDAFRTFWSTPQAWGTFSQVKSAKARRAEVRVLHGALPLRSLSLALPATACTARVAGRKIAASLQPEAGGAEITFDPELALRPDQALDITMESQRPGLNPPPSRR